MKAHLAGVAKIWDTAPHNAFASLTRFREGFSHVSEDGAIRVIRSIDGVTLGKRRTPHRA